MAASDPAIPKTVHAWALGSFAALSLVLIVLFLIYGQVNVWAPLQASGELRDIHYSETVYIDSLFRTRANTWSNLAFVLVGFYALAMAVWDRRQTPSWFYGAPITAPILTLLFGVACTYLGVGSGVFHASITRWGQQLDVASMYPPMLALMTMLIHRNLTQRLWQTNLRAQIITASGLILLVGVAAIVFYVYKWSMSSKTVLPSLVLALNVLYLFDRFLWTPKGRLRWLFASFAAVFLGTLCRQLDVAGKFSGPDAWYQGHAFWHVLCALSLAFGWWYIRSGPDPESTQQPAHTHE